MHERSVWSPRRALYFSTAGLVGLVCVALISLDGARTWQAYVAERAESRNATDNLVQSLAQHVEDTVRTVDVLIVGVKQRIEKNGLSEGEVHRVRDSVAAQTRVINGQIEDLSVYDAKGDLLPIMPAPLPPDANLSTRDDYLYHLRHIDDQIYIGGPYKNEETGNWTMSVSRRLNNTDGSFAGIVLGTITLDLFRQYQASLEIGLHGALILARSDGTILMRRPYQDALVGQRNFSGTLFAETIPAAFAGRFDIKSRIDGFTRLGSFRHVAGYPLVVLAALEQGEVLADWASEAQAHALGVLLVIVIIILLGMRLAKQIAHTEKIEARLRQSEKMQVIGRLAAGVAHDFNNILQVITGGVEVLKEEMPSSSRASTLIGMVESAALRGSNLTHYLLSYSRKQMLNPAPLDLRRQFDALRDLLARTLPANIDVTIRLRTKPDIGPVRADAALLETALLNLAINAAYAMPEGGGLDFEIGQAIAAPAPERGAEIGAEMAPGRYLVIAATDTGCGIPPGIIGQIFEPFFTTKGLDGTGLGLAMVQGFSRQSGGDVRVASTEGEGTRFEIWLPQVPVEADDDGAPALRRRLPVPQQADAV